jgi:cyclase
MINYRIIPIILIKGNGVYKSINFKKLNYIGDPINTIKIFNDKGADELIILDINATNNNAEPNYALLSNLAYECNMPICYGGGITTLNQIEKILSLGFEKISLNTIAFQNPRLVMEACKNVGSSTIVVSIDAKKSMLSSSKVFINSGTKSTRVDVVSYAREIESLGAGEILLNSIDRDGTMLGYDLNLVQSVANAVQIPIIASGGANNLKNIEDVTQNAKASAAGVGSFFLSGNSPRSFNFLPKLN